MLFFYIIVYYFYIFFFYFTAPVPAGPLICSHFNVKVRDMMVQPFVVFTPPSFKAAVFITEVVSGFSQNFNYPLQMFSSNVYYGSLGLISMSQNRAMQDMFPASILMIDQRMPKDDSSDFGSVSTPFFSYGNRFCMPVNFTNRLRSTPVIVASVQLMSLNYSQAVTLWIQSVSDTSAVFCLHELLAFTGVKFPSKINYYAIVPGDNNTEVGRLHFEAGLYGNQIDELENLRYCKTVLFEYRYQDAPHVFVTPQNGDLTAGMVSAWVNRVSNSFAVICAKNQNDAYYFGVSKIVVNYLVKGEMDACSNFACPENRECFIDERSNPTCGCKRSCPLPNLNETLCGNNHVTYKSKCYMHLESCQMYGQEMMERVRMAYPGPCKGKSNENSI